MGAEVENRPALPLPLPGPRCPSRRLGRSPSQHLSSCRPQGQSLLHHLEKLGLLPFFFLFWF